MARVSVGLSHMALEKLFGAVAGRSGIKVELKEDCVTPHASALDVVTLPKPSALDGIEFWCKAFHEMGHLMPKLLWTFNKLPLYVNMEDDLVLAVANVLADNLDERHLYDLGYEGIINILDEGRAGIMRDDWIKSVAPHLPNIKKNPVSSLMCALISADCSIRQQWMGVHMQSLPAREWCDEFPELIEGMGKLELPKRLNEIHHSIAPAKPCGQLILDILKLIGYDPPPPPPQEGQGEGDGEGDSNGDGQEGQGEGADGSSSGTGEGEGEGQAKHDGSEHATQDNGNFDGFDESDPLYNPDGKGTGPADCDFPSQVGDFNHEAILKALKEDLTKRLEAAPDWRKPDRYQGDSYRPHGKNSIRDLQKDVSNFRPQLRQSIVSALGTSTISKQISKYLKAMVSDSYTYGQKRGQIHQKNIHKMIGNKPQPGVQPGIFKRKNNSVLKSDSAVTLLVDCSGSMSGSKYTIAAACAVAMSETLTSIGIPHEILGFSQDQDLVTYVFKDFGVTLTKEKLISIFANRRIDMWSNADGESVMYAAERLMFRKEKRKMLVVFSDGMPCGNYYGDGTSYLKHVCETIENESPIDLVGIGIKTRAVERFYTHHVIVDNPKMLDSVLFSVLKNFLT